MSNSRTSSDRHRGMSRRQETPAFEPLENRRLMSGSHFDGRADMAEAVTAGSAAGRRRSRRRSRSASPRPWCRAALSARHRRRRRGPYGVHHRPARHADGLETYSLTEGSTTTGTTTTPARLTVDVEGNTVPAATSTTTTFGALTSTAVTAELTAIAAALSLTRAASTDTVDVHTAENGAVTYSVSLAPTSTTDTRDVRITVDSGGNPAGNEQVPLSVLSATVQAALTANAPAGATALTASSPVQVRTDAGVILYTAQYSSTGTKTSVTVNTAGTLTSLPSTTQVDFSTIPAAAQTELQTLATADGYTGTIPATQTVNAHTEATGAVIYRVTLSVTATTSSLIDARRRSPSPPTRAGNPTVTPGEFDGSDRGRGDYAPPSTGTPVSSTGTTPPHDPPHDRTTSCRPPARRRPRARKPPSWRHSPPGRPPPRRHCRRRNPPKPRIAPRKKRRPCCGRDVARLLALVPSPGVPGEGTRQPCSRRCPGPFVRLGPRLHRHSLRHAGPVAAEGELGRRRAAAGFGQANLIDLRAAADDQQRLRFGPPHAPAGEQIVTVQLGRLQRGGFAAVPRVGEESARPLPGQRHSHVPSSDHSTDPIHRRSSLVRTPSTSCQRILAMGRCASKVRRRAMPLRCS